MLFVFFGLSLSSSWGNGHATTYRGLLAGLQELGHQTVFFEHDVEWYASHRDLPHPPMAELHLYSDWRAIRSAAIARARAADVVIVGSYFPDAIPLLDEFRGAPRSPLLCFYDIDTPVTLNQLGAGHCAYLRASQIPAVDLYLSFTGGPVLDELHRRWHAACVRPLYCGCEAKVYAAPPAGMPQARFALGYLGTYAPDRQAKLERLLLEPARQLPHLAFRVAGSMYPGVHSWPANVHYDFHLPPDQHVAFYSSCRFTLNLTRQAMVEAGYSPSIRLFEAASGGHPILTDPWPGLHEFFRPGDEILVAAETTDVLSHLRLSLREARRIGVAGRQRVLRAHTGLHRARQLEGYIQELNRTRWSVAVS